MIRSAHWAWLAGLLLVTAVYQTWNAVTLPATMGYDTKHHRKYIDVIVDEGRLPHPLEGWSTFHPPLYHGFGSLVTRALSGLGEPAVVLGLKAISLLSILSVGAVCFLVLKRLGANAGVCAVAAALALYVPCASMAASMIGNEALTAALAALALPAILRLQADPRDLRAGIVAGLLAGLAVVTKYSGIVAVVACAVPFLRFDFDRRVLRALVVCLLAGSSVSLPVYVRNLQLTGSLAPRPEGNTAIERSLERYTFRERRVSDYLWLDPAIFLRPSLYHVKGQKPDPANRNPAMTNVWGLTYAGFWYDPFAHRIPRGFHRDGVQAGRVTTLLGVVPTTMVLLGFLSGLRDLFRRRSATPDAPLVVMSIAGLVGFVLVTWDAPSAMVVKGAYLMPLTVPAAAFYWRGLRLLGDRSRVAVLVASVAAVAASAAVFAHGLVFPLLRAAG